MRLLPLLLVVLLLLTMGCIEEYQKTSEAIDHVFYVLMGWEDLDVYFSDLAPRATYTPQSRATVTPTPLPLVTVSPTPEPTANPNVLYFPNNIIISHASNVDDDWNGSYEDGVFHYYRANSHSDGGHVSLKYEPWLHLDDVEEIIIRGELKVVNYTLHSSGWWAETYDTDTADWPAYLHFLYVDSTGNGAGWEWGYLAEENTLSKTNYDLIELNEWYEFETPNLMELEPRPDTFYALWIGGQGWDFEGYFRNVEIVVDGEIIS